MFAEFLLVGYPGGFPWFYLVMNNILMLFRSVTTQVVFVIHANIILRYLTYKAIKNHFFMLDFCYFINVRPEYSI